MKFAARVWLSTGEESCGMAAFRIDRDFCTFTLSDCQYTFRLEWFPVEETKTGFVLTDSTIRSISSLMDRLNKLMLSKEPSAQFFFTLDNLRYRVKKVERIVEDKNKSLITVKFLGYSRSIQAKMKNKKKEQPAPLLLLHAVRGTKEWETKKERIRTMAMRFKELAQSLRKTK